MTSEAPVQCKTTADFELDLQWAMRLLWYQINESLSCRPRHSLFAWRTNDYKKWASSLQSVQLKEGVQDVEA